MNRSEAASIAVPESSSLPEENEEPPGKARRHPKWNDVPEGQWDDWRWQMQNAIRTTSQLAEFFSYGPQEFAALETLEQKYKLAIPPYYFSLINTDDPRDPIGLQSLPSSLELPAARLRKLRLRSARKASDGDTPARFATASANSFRFSDDGVERNA